MARNYGILLVPNSRSCTAIWAWRPTLEARCDTTHENKTRHSKRHMARRRDAGQLNTKIMSCCRIVVCRVCTMKCHGKYRRSRRDVVRRVTLSSAVSHVALSVVRRVPRASHDTHSDTRYDARQHNETGDIKFGIYRIPYAKNNNKKKPYLQINNKTTRNHIPLLLF